MKRLGILMLGGARRVSIGRMFMRAGAEAGYEVKLFSYELDRCVPIAEIAEIVIGRKWSDPTLMDHLEEIVECCGIDIILPFVDGAVEVTARFCQLNHRVFAPVSTEEVSRAMFDKLKADELFRAAGIPVPRSVSLENGPYPIIAKPRRGSASKGIKIMNSISEVNEIECRDEYLFQEYISNREEFTVDCYVGRSGMTTCAVPRRRVEVIGGEVSRTVTVDYPELVGLSHQVLDTLGLRGAVTLQFIRDLTDGRLMLMEINPRLGGGVVCSVHAGADIPSMIIDESIGEMPVPAGYEPGVEIVRYMQEVVFHNNSHE